jgi:hypothetical protein
MVYVALSIIIEALLDSVLFTYDVCILYCMLLFIQASYEPLAPLGETNVEEYLNYHHQVIINAAIDDAKVYASITSYITLSLYCNSDSIGCYEAS